MAKAVERLAPRFVERVWGRRDLGPLFSRQERPVGEVWFQTEPPLPVLIKFIFTNEALSVQVHPNDEQARARGLANGKTEMWRILEAAPGARIALGFERRLTPEEARAACLDGSVERLLHYEEAVRGAVYFTPANTVHALGAGLSLVEIQQNSDTTYRLYDYGRPRELHLEEGLAVADLGRWIPPEPGRDSEPPWRTLGECAYFHTEEAEISGGLEVECGQPWALFIVLEGEGRLGGERIKAGEVWRAGERTEKLEIVPEPRMQLLRVRP